jgi:hypothetical protein
LTRLVAIGPASRFGAYRIYLAATAAGPCGTPNARAMRVLLITVTSRHGGQLSWGMAFSAADRERFAIIPVGPGAYYHGGQLLSSVIPDGVVRVKWVFGYVPHPGGVKHRPPLTVYPSVRDNVAVADIGPWETQSSATLSFADGRLLTSKDEAASLPVCHPRDDRTRGGFPLHERQHVLSPRARGERRPNARTA